MFVICRPNHQFKIQSVTYTRLSSYLNRKEENQPKIQVKVHSFMSNQSNPFWLVQFPLSHSDCHVTSRVSNRNSVAHCVAGRNAIFTAISARFVAHISLPLAPNLRLKVFFLAHQQCGILGAIKVYFSHKFHIDTSDYLTF